jgi:NAD(P)-dependent dehydrogenase (short-subunit alcohol dehydrogenase family)
MTILQSLTPPPGLRVLITAGAAGIGQAIARGFLEAGARVHVSDIDAEAVTAARAAGCIATLCDAADPDQSRALFDTARQAMGGLDVVVANAGIAGPTMGIADVDEAAWDRTLEVNLRGAYLAARFAAPDLVASRGSFIAISSVAGRLGFGLRTPYAASKWGVVGLVKSLAVELGPDGVRANAILPGIVKGPRIERVIAARAQQLGQSHAETEEQNLQKVALRRMVAPEDIAAMCLFLSSPGGANITGQSLSVCAGVEAL